MRRLRTLAGIFLLVVLFAAKSTGQELPTATPEEVGLSAEKLARVTSAVQSLIDDRKVAGAITIVARRGKVVYFEAAGKRDIGANRAMERDTICRIYSMTKPITSVAVMLLVEQGRLDLDDPVTKHLPEFNGAKVFVKATASGIETEASQREPTVRDLLRHTGGLTYGVFAATPIDQMYLKSQVLDPRASLADLTKKLGEIPLLYQPGTKWNYSVSVDVLGRIVEVISGTTLDEFLAEQIFRPLDMKDTGFFVPEQKLDRFATCYGPSADGGLRAIETPQSSPFRSKPALLSGGGGLLSTARDYMRFCQMLDGGGALNGKRLLRRETVAMMTKNQLPDEAYPIAFGPIQRAGVGFGLGFAVQVDEHPSSGAGRAGEYGWGGLASTHFWISPQDDLVVIVLQQFIPFTMRLEQAIKPLVYDAIVE